MKPKIFISYIAENLPVIKLVKRELQYAGAQVWLDRDALKPGTRWKKEIRANIDEADYFLAFFSEEYKAKERSYMNEELTIAIENIRLLNPEKIWFIPIRIDNCDVPDIAIGKGETLEALQWIDLDTANPDGGLEKLITLLNPPKELITVDLSNVAYLENYFSRSLMHSLGHTAVAQTSIDSHFPHNKEIDFDETSGNIRMANAYNEILLRLSKQLRDLILINDDRFYFIRKKINLRGIVWQLAARITAITQWHESTVIFHFEKRDRAFDYWVRISIELFEYLIIVLSDLLLLYMGRRGGRVNSAIVSINISDAMELTLRAELSDSNIGKPSKVRGFEATVELIKQILSRLNGEIKFTINQKEYLRKIVIRIPNVDPRLHD